MKILSPTLIVHLRRVLMEEATFCVLYVFILEIYLRRYGQKSQPFVDIFKWHIVLDQERTVRSVMIHERTIFESFELNSEKVGTLEHPKVKPKYTEKDGNV